MLVTLKGRCMGKSFQCNTGETFPLSSFLKNDKECFVNANLDKGVLTIQKILWLKCKEITEVFEE